MAFDTEKIKEIFCISRIVKILSKLCYFQSREEDINKDGRPDNLLFTLELPLLDTESLLGIKLIMIFDYKLFVSWWE